MEHLDRTINAFTKLGNFLREFTKEPPDPARAWSEEIRNAVGNAHLANNWFTIENLYFALRAWGEALQEEKVKRWLQPYFSVLPKSPSMRNVFVIMAGNIPLAGLHDMLCVLASGNRFIGKMSSKDDKLLKIVAGYLSDIEPQFGDCIEFTDSKPLTFDAVIATGTDLSERYFNYYFGRYPHIFRRNRNSVAILTGDESRDELKKLGDDIFTYFGLGCRSVSKIYVPDGYDFGKMAEAFLAYSNIINHAKYGNNYDYQKAIFLLNKVNFHDTGFFMIKEDRSFSSPVAVLHYEQYGNREELLSELREASDRLQCIAGSKELIHYSGIKKQNDHGGSVPLSPYSLIPPDSYRDPYSPLIEFGKTQKPDLWEYADGADTVGFLLKLKGD